MPYKDPVERREYLRRYQRSWMAARRAEFFDGKRCVSCGSTERLELDHVNPADKEHHAIWSWRKERRDAEIAKCVVRCRACHVERHAALRRSHGIGGYKRGCRCDVCREAKRDNNARYREGRSKVVVALAPAQRPGPDLHRGTRLCRALPNCSATGPSHSDLIQMELFDAA